MLFTYWVTVSEILISGHLSFPNCYILDVDYFTDSQSSPRVMWSKP